MKAKTIKKICNNKFHHWLMTIPDEGNGELKKLIQENTIITGGAIVSMLLNEEVNDFDLYFRNKETAVKVAEYYTNLFIEKHPNICDGSVNGERLLPKVIETSTGAKVYIKSAGALSAESDNLSYSYFESFTDHNPENTDFYVDALTSVLQTDSNVPNYHPIFITDNAITLKNQMQIVLRFTGEPDVIHDTYDFIHCKCYWTSWNNELELPKDALEAILTKELIYTGSQYPICSIIRTRKFIQRGWSCTAGQYLKMAFQCSEMDLNCIEVLQDQLTGVDAAYFAELISYLKQNAPDKIDAIYIAQLIDSML